jgi:hypothetical protein
MRASSSTAHEQISVSSRNSPPQPASITLQLLVMSPSNGHEPLRLPTPRPQAPRLRLTEPARQAHQSTHTPPSALWALPCPHVSLSCLLDRHERSNRHRAHRVTLRYGTRGSYHYILCPPSFHGRPRPQVAHTRTPTHTRNTTKPTSYRTAAACSGAPLPYTPPRGADAPWP